MNQQFIIFILTLIFLCFPSLAWAETVIEKVKRTGILTAGVRQDAVPFAYLNQQNEVEGYAVDLIQLIHRRLEANLNQSIRLEFQPVTIDERFQVVQNGTVDLLCSATSINPEQEQVIDFSIPFFNSGIQLLVRQTDANRLASTPVSDSGIQSILSGTVTIGFLEGTTTESDFRPIYPEAEWRALENRAAGIQQLNNQEIDAIASDGILLLGEVQRQGGDRNQFSLVPQQALTFEDYGCILPENNPQLKTIVNQTIVSDENKQLKNQWFNPQTGKFPYQ